MKNLNVLLGNADRRTNALIEATLLDVCYGHAVVNLTRAARVDELARKGSCKGFDLIIVAPEDLLPCASRMSSPITLEESTRTIAEFKSLHLTTILAVNVSEPNQPAVLEAGADEILGVPLDRQQLRDRLGQIFRLPEAAETPNRWAWVGVLLQKRLGAWNS